MGQVVEEVECGESLQRGMRPKQSERADGVCPLPRERSSMIRAERLGQHEVPVHRIGEAEDCRDPEWGPWSKDTQHTAERGADDEADAERRPHEAVRARPLLWRRHVGDIGERRRHTRRRHAGEHASHEQPAERRRERHQHVVGAQADVGHENRRPAAVPIGEPAEHGRGEELDAGPDGAEQSNRARRRGRVATAELLDENRQHGDDHSQCEHVEQDSDEDEGDSGLARARVG